MWFYGKIILVILKPNVSPCLSTLGFSTNIYWYREKYFSITVETNGVDTHKKDPNESVEFGDIDFDDEVVAEETTKEKPNNKKKTE